MKKFLLNQENRHLPEATEEIIKKENSITRIYVIFVRDLNHLQGLIKKYGQIQLSENKSFNMTKISFIQQRK